MSNREIAIDLINNLPEYKLAYIITFLKGVTYDDDIEDDIYCRKLVDEYLNDKSPDKHETVSVEDLAKELDIAL